MTGDGDGTAGEEPTGKEPTGTGASGEDPTVGASRGGPGDGPAPASRADLETLHDDVVALEETLETLRDELVAGGRGPRLRPPRLRDLRRFTTEVTIPMTILVLETNVRLLRILQRALRVADEEAGGRSERATLVGRQAADVSRRTLGRLEGVLADLQERVRADGDALPGLLEEAATLQERVQTELDRLEAADTSTSAGTSAGDVDSRVDADSVAIDVDAELESIRSEIADDEGDADG